jgi:hypothetical protein
MVKSKSHSRYNLKSKKNNKNKKFKNKKYKHKTKKYKLFGGVSIYDLKNNIFNKPKIFKKYFELFVKDFSNKLKFTQNNDEISFDISNFKNNIYNECNIDEINNNSIQIDKVKCDILFINIYALIRIREFDIKEIFEIEKDNNKYTLQIDDYNKEAILKKLKSKSNELYYSSNSTLTSNKSLVKSSPRRQKFEDMFKDAFVFYFKKFIDENENEKNNYSVSRSTESNDKFIEYDELKKILCITILLLCMSVYHVKY